MIKEKVKAFCRFIDNCEQEMIIRGDVILSKDGEVLYEL